MKFSSATFAISWIVTLSAFGSAAARPSPQGRWTTLPSLPIARQEHGTAALGDDIFVIGGISPDASNNGSSPVVNTVQAYSISKRQWRTLSPLPVSMTHANVASVAGKIVVLGGLGTDVTGTVWGAVGDCFAYDASTDEWDRLPSMPKGQERGASAVGVYRDSVYLAGGMTVLNLVSSLQASVDNVTAYNARSQTWTTLPSLPGRRDHVGGAVVDKTFFVIGGRDHGQNNSKNTTFAMDLDRPEKGWTTKAPMPTARGGLSIGSIGNFIATFGGEGNSEVRSGVYNNTEIYDVAQDKWTKSGPMPVPRHGTIAASTCGHIFIPGGGKVQSAGPVDSFVAFSL